MKRFYDIDDPRLKKVKDKLKELRAEKQKAIEAKDAAQLKTLRRRYHNLNHKIRSATTA